MSTDGGEGRPVGADGSRPGLLRRKGPELLLEAALIVFAVLVALAVDEWNEGRELQVQVDRARTAVEAELRANRGELLASGPTVEAMFDTVAAMVGRLRTGGTVGGADLGAEIPDFSDAAWETARVTGTVAHMDYPWVLEIARVYETQDQALQVQNELLGTIGSLSAHGLEEEILTELQGQLFIALQMYGNLAEKYAEALGSAGSTADGSDPRDGDAGGG